MTWVLPTQKRKKLTAARLEEDNVSEILIKLVALVEFFNKVNRIKSGRASQYERQ